MIGDGALPSGIVFEALNNAGFLKRKMLIVLNDNKMSICPRVGSLAEYLDTVRTNCPVSQCQAGDGDSDQGRADGRRVLWSGCSNNVKDSIKDIDPRRPSLRPSASATLARSTGTVAAAGSLTWK